jgi:hypothetical protein
LLSLHHLGRASEYLLISPDETAARRISSTRRPISIPLGRLHIQRWSRLHNSSGGLLPIAMEIELRGIPTHAWDLDTAAQLLSDCCIPCGVHPETASQRKVFRLGAWCSDPGAIPPEIDLEIPEPEVIGRAARERRSLIYHVKISSRTAGVQVPADDPPPSTSQMDDDHRQRGRRYSASSLVPATHGGSAPARAHRAPVHRRLGPASVDCGGVDQATTSGPVHAATPLPKGLEASETAEDSSIKRPVEGTYNGRLRADCKPITLQKHPHLSQATSLLSSRERTAGARAPRAYRQPQHRCTLG